MRYNKKLMSKFIIQIYDPAQLEVVKKNFPSCNVIFTLYRTKLSDKDVLNFVHKNTDYIKAVTVSEKHFFTELAKALNKIKTPTYVHTINNEEKMFYYIKKGAFGFYTDAPSNLLNVLKKESY
jgi:glycerophosphoryl diester phosphodiesterase